MPLNLDETHITERFIRGSGPGGQAINKLSTNVELVHTPTGERVTCQASRSRQQNRTTARRILSQRLEHLVKIARAAHDPRASSPSVLQSRWDKQRKRKQNRAKKQRKRANAAAP